jgi:hypothetical protein
MGNDRFFALLLWLSAILIAGCSAFFSVRGIGLLFAGSMIPVVIMASSLEVGKLMTASFLYRCWKKTTFWLKSYLTIATIALIGITSMGIYGFLSDAFSKTSARIEFYEENIKQLESQNKLSKEQIGKIEGSANMVDSKAEDAIDNFQKIYDDYVSDQRARQSAINARLKELDLAVTELELSKGGLFSNKKTKLEALKLSQEEERVSIRSQLADIDKNIDGEYKKFLSKVDQYRETTSKVDVQPDIDGFYLKIKENDEKVLKFKENIKNTDIGSFKFIARAFDIPLDDVVKWFIIIIVAVFDPLAISLIIAWHVYTGRKQLSDISKDQKKTKEIKLVEEIEPDPNQKEDSKVDDVPEDEQNRNLKKVKLKKKRGLGILKKYLRAGALRDEIIKEKLEKENTEGEED